MAARARRGGRGNSGENMDVWRFTNNLRNCPTTTNAVPTLPDLADVSVDTNLKEYVGRMCLLQVSDAKDAEEKFAKRLCNCVIVAIVFALL